MKSSIFYFVFLVTIAINLIACNRAEEDDSMANFTNEVLCQAIVDMDDNEIEVEMDDLLIDLLPITTPTDELGHALNLDKLVERMNRSACMSASLRCYACIETLPVISEIDITIEEGDQVLVRTMDISTPEDKVLSFLTVHL